MYIYIYTYVIYIYIPHPLLPRARSSWRLRLPLLSHSPSSRSRARRLRVCVQDAYQHACACRSRMNSRLFDYDLYCKFFDYDLFDYDLCFTTFFSSEISIFDDLKISTYEIALFHAMKVLGATKTCSKKTHGVFNKTKKFLGLEIFVLCTTLYHAK